MQYLKWERALVAGLSELEFLDCVTLANGLGDLSCLSPAGKAGQIPLGSFALNKLSTFHLPIQDTQPLAAEFQNSYYLFQSLRGLVYFLTNIHNWIGDPYCGFQKKQCNRLTSSCMRGGLGIKPVTAASQRSAPSLITPYNTHLASEVLQCNCLHL